MDTLDYIRYAQEGDRLIVEKHVFYEIDGGFLLPATLFPAAGPKMWNILQAGNPLYIESFDTTVYPLDFALRPGVTLFATQADYDAAIAAAKPTPTGGPGDDGATVLVYSDDDKIFIIDFNGNGVKNNVDKRRHFNIVYGFDPVDDDPRN